METPSHPWYARASCCALAALIVLMATPGLTVADQASINATRVLSDVTELEGSANGGVVVALHRGEVALFNATTLAPVTTFYPPSGQPTSIGLSPSGVTLAIGLNNSTVLLYNTSTLAIEAWGLVPSTPDNWVTALRWSPDGSMLAVRAGDGKLRIFDASLGLLANFTQQSEGPIEWADIGGNLSVVSQGVLGVNGIALWHLNGTAEPLTGQYYSSYGDATWTMWPDGRFLAIQAPHES